MALFAVSRRGHVFQSEATTSNPIAPYTVGRESNANLPNRTPLDANTASRIRTVPATIFCSEKHRRQGRREKRDGQGQQVFDRNQKAETN